MDSWQAIANVPAAAKRGDHILIGWGWYQNTRTWARALISWSEWAECWQSNSLPFVPTHYIDLPAPPTLKDE